MGLEISWLLPAAFLALILGLAVVRRDARTSLVRSGLVIWGGWLVVTGLVFSFMSGTIHPYYTVALAPAVAGRVATGGVCLWRSRGLWAARLGLAAMVGSAGVWGFVLLSKDTSWLPWLRWSIVVGALVCAVLFLVGSALDLRRVTAVALLAGTMFGLAGTTSYSIATASVAHSGSIPTAGSAASASGMGAGRPAGGAAVPVNRTGGTAQPTGANPDAGGAPGGAGQNPGTTGDSSSSALVALLKATSGTWSAAVNGSQSASTLELSSGTAVMAIGGWSSDPTPTLAQFKADVRAGKVGYYIVSGQGAGSGSGTASAIESWVAATFTATTVGGSTVYDLGGHAG